MQFLKSKNRCYHNLFLDLEKLLIQNNNNSKNKNEQTKEKREVAAQKETKNCIKNSDTREGDEDLADDVNNWDQDKNQKEEETMAYSLKKNGFTLIELLLVIVIISLLLGIIVGAAIYMRKKSYQTKNIYILQHYLP